MSSKQSREVEVAVDVYLTHFERVLMQQQQMIFSVASF